jgi:hypothetical protein
MFSPNEEVEITAFFLELPVKGKAVVTAVGKTGMDWEIRNEKLKNAIKSEREFFFVKNGRLYACDVLFIQPSLSDDKLFCSTTTPKRKIDPRFYRQSPRVAVSLKDPVFVEVNGKQYRAKDVSEYGISFLIDHSEAGKNIKFYSDIEGTIRMLDTAFPFRGKTVSFEVVDGKTKVGVLLKDADFKKLKAYVQKRQREISKLLSGL